MLSPASIFRSTLNWWGNSNSIGSSVPFCLENNRKICLYLAVASVCLWNVYAIWRVFTLAHVPDEIWFYIVALENYKSESFNPFFAENKFAYGGVWFAIYHLMICFSELFSPVSYSSISFLDTSSLLGENFEYTSIAPLLLMRALSLFSINVVLFLYIRRLRQGEIWAFFSLIFFLSFPMLYWGGKLASPDVLSCVILFLGIWSFRRHKRRAYIFFGAALAVKLSALPLFALLVIFHLITAIYFFVSSASFLDSPNIAKSHIYYQRQKLFLDLYVGLTLCLLVFFVCNLYAIAHTEEYLKNIVFFTSAFADEDVFLSWSNFFGGAKARLGNENGQLWDLVNPGGFFYWSSSALVVVLAFFISFYFSKSKINPIFIACAFFATFVFVVRQPAFGWNWFPFIIIFPLLLSFVKINRISIILLILLCALSFFVNFPHMRREISLVYQHDKILSEFLARRSELVAEVNAFLADLGVERRPRILNLIDIGAVYPNSESYNDSFWRHKDNIRAGDLILLGDRVRNYHEGLLLELQTKFEYSEARWGSIAGIYILNRR